MALLDLLQSRCSQVIILDTETGGVDHRHHSILSIGLVSWDQKHQHEIFVLEPVLQTNPRSMEINRIDLEWLKATGVNPAEACRQMDAFFEQCGWKEGETPFLLAGHNLAFDLAFLRRLYDLADRPMPPYFSHRSIDTHSLLWTLASLGVLPPSVCSSDGAFKHYQVAPPQELRHTALGDALATRDLLEAILLEFQNGVSA